MEVTSIKGKVLIIGEMPCCICGQPMTQKDVNEGRAILQTTKSLMPFIGIITHSNHLYIEGLPTEDHELNFHKFVLATVKFNGGAIPEKVAELEEEIKQLEQKQQNKTKEI